MSVNFKTALFGGFDKEDVVRFIEEMGNSNKEAVTSLNREIEDLRNQIQELLADNESMRAAIEETNSALEENENLRAALTEKEEQLSSYKEEIPALREKAAELAGIRDHIAEIEISAHKRTEEFRKNAIAQLNGMLDQQQQWCQTQKDAYIRNNQTVKEKLQEALAQFIDANCSGFDSTLDSLSALREQLNND